jgi:hypothetical protein
MLALESAVTVRVGGGWAVSSDRCAHGLDDERVWAIEDCRSVSRRLEEALVAAGERVVRVAPHRMGASRRGERDPGKSDERDSLAIARAVVKYGPARSARCAASSACVEDALETLDHTYDPPRLDQRAQRADVVVDRAALPDLPRAG